MTVEAKLLELKHVNLYKCVPIAQKNKLLELMRGKELRDHDKHEYLVGRLYIDEILSHMRERYMRYPEYYDSTDRILDLNFYTTSKKGMTVSARRPQQLVAEALHI
ncbi:hypothetical protein H5410_035006 [Solanum commersonii]|uniref:Uncharacterized protein n=1 Tax=Solanum commersonii TaxID=4109 RepID=A0A9J5Y3T9_SOLCO|nr:hypothetical protein H5410_035006 [Solanum commersonii]